MNLTFLKNYFSQQSGRNKSVIKNVGLGFAAKGLSILIGFLQIPVTLSILDKTSYGVWITIFSVTSWLSFFDIGMGNGFRNKLTEALADNDVHRAKKIVSTTYFSLGAIFVGIIILFIPISLIVPWQQVFKAPPELKGELYWTVFISVISTALNFVFGLIHTVLAAHHKTGKSSILFLLSQFGILVILYVCSLSNPDHAFLIVAGVLALIPLLSNILINIWFFVGRYHSISPALSQYEGKYLKELMSIGIMFFVIQIAAVVIYATDNLIITQLYGPDDVVTYSLVYRYYSILSIVSTIVMAPLWTMYVDAYKKGDKVWIFKSINNLVKLLYLFILAIAIMIVLSKVFFSIWIGSDFKPSLMLNILIGLYVIIFMWGNIWVLPLNAAGKIRIQMIVSIIVACLNVPIIYLLHNFIPNISSVVLGNIICMILGCGYMYLYYKKTVRAE